GRRHRQGPVAQARARVDRHEPRAPGRRPLGRLLRAPVRRRDAPRGDRRGLQRRRPQRPQPLLGHEHVAGGAHRRGRGVRAGERPGGADRRAAELRAPRPRARPGADPARDRGQGHGSRRLQPAGAGHAPGHVRRPRAGGLALRALRAVQAALPHRGERRQGEGVEAHRRRAGHRARAARPGLAAPSARGHERDHGRDARRADRGERGSGGGRAERRGPGPHRGGGRLRRLYTARQMAEADARAVAAGVPVDALMEAAGRTVARVVRERFPAAGRVLLLCGPGNNGGDGYVAARELAAGLEVTVLEAAPPRTEAARGARASLTAVGVEPGALSAGAVDAWLASADPDAAVVVDALLGSGLTRPLGGDLAAVAAALNAGQVPVVAVDVPTGVDADVAVPPGEHVRADVTVQLAGAKVASAFHPARAAFEGARPGRPAGVVVADIGVPEDVLAAVSPTLWLDREATAAWLPRRAPDDHKYAVGTVTVVAGSRRYLGAGELACRGAWRAGAGLVTLVGAEPHPAAWRAGAGLVTPVGPERRPSAWPGTIHVPPPGDGEWPPPGLTARAARALVVGPGLDPAEPGSSLAALGALLEWAPGRVVLDAGALAPGTFTDHLTELRALARRDAPAVVTPHAGEAARLLAALGREVDVRRDPLGAARALAEDTEAVVALKGATTVVAAPDGREAVSDSGHPGLAGGGTGDVLAGAIGALLAAPGGDV